MLAAGAGTLYLASWFGTTKETYIYQAWQYSYLIMAGAMLVGVATTLIIPEPEEHPNAQPKATYSTGQYLRFLLLFLLSITALITVFIVSSGLAASIKMLAAENFPTHKGLIAFCVEGSRLLCALIAALVTALLLTQARLADKTMVKCNYVEPIADFFRRYGIRSAVLLLLLVGFYRVSDIVLGVISNIFYQDLGFSKEVIASIIKIFGVLMTLVGGFIGGIMTVRYGVFKVLFLGGLLSSITNLLFLWLATVGDNVSILTLVIAADNLSAGIATTAFVAFLSSLTSISFTATQYAIFSSLMMLFPKLIGGYSGTMVTAWGYETFFLMTTLMGMPVLLLVWFAGRLLDTNTS
jgi:PAT family beta-lactamase induction signal transducer AmpG